MNPPARCHRRQSKPNTCVPACACIALRRRGQSPPSDAQLAASWLGSGRGYDIAYAADALGAEWKVWDPNAPAIIEHLRAVLANGHWLIVQVFTAVLQAHYDAAPPPAPGPFGPLPREPGWLHAIVLVAAEAEGSFRYLDPYHETSGQPLGLSAETLAEALQGALIVC